MAYDLKELLGELKGKGLDIAEEAAGAAVDAVLTWVEKSALASENKYDDLLLAVTPLLREQIKPLIDKIDGEVDEPQT